MNIILYESASRGGNFEYSRSLFEAYSKNSGVRSINWIIPTSADEPAGPGIQRLLCNDRRRFRVGLFSQLHFAYRSLVNPLILLRYLSTCDDKRYVILNDFEQLTAFLWVPLYKLFARRHHFSVVLHDPDRDAYPPSKMLSIWSMKKMMSVMSLALYHEYLPDKSYYKNASTRYLDVPHGQYTIHPADAAISELLQSFREGDRLAVIVGNIRTEKNYETSIQAIARLSGVKLVIAGSPSSSSVNLSDLEKLVLDLGVANRVLFIVRYLSDAELSSVVAAASVILLNYKRSFTSQSGIFNTIAPFKKSIVVSRIESGLGKIASRFGLGTFVDPDSVDDLLTALPKALDGNDDLDARWDQYLQYASWENHVNIVLDALKHSYVQG